MNIKSCEILLLTLLLTACEGYKTPWRNQGPAGMSADTLCYRAASHPTPELNAEITARHLDCEAILATDPLYR